MSSLACRSQTAACSDESVTPSRAASPASAANGGEATGTPVSYVRADESGSLRYVRMRPAVLRARVDRVRGNAERPDLRLRVPALRAVHHPGRHPYLDEPRQRPAPQPLP